MKNLSATYFLFLLIFIGYTAYSQSVPDSIPKNGLYQDFYKNTQIKTEGHYKQSLKQGIWYYYAENGVVERKEKYIHGILRWQIFFSPKGKITKTIDKNGKVTERHKCGC